MFVRDCMRSPVVTITPDTQFQDVLKLMHKHRLRRLPVVNAAGKLVGMISERDLLYVSPSPDTSLRVWELIYLVSKLQDCGIIDKEFITAAPELRVEEFAYLLSEIQLREIMTKDVITTTPNTPIEDAAYLMVENKLGGLPVVDEDGIVAGVITGTDIFVAFVEMFAGGHSGLRLTLGVPPKTGVLSELCQAVCDLGGSIVSAGSFRSTVSNECGLVIKVQDIQKDQLVDTLGALGDHVIDAHEVGPHYSRRRDVMTTRILVPLDGSPRAERALPCAAMLARGLPAELVLFRAISLPTDIKDILVDADLKADSALAALEAEAEQYLRQLVDQLQEDGLCVQPVVRQGPAAEAIVQCADQMNIQQIVMGTRGHSGFSRLRHGSVADSVLQAANIPVLVVCAHKGEKRRPHEPKVCRRILVPLDGSHIAEQILPPTVVLAQALDAEIVLFRVSVACASGSLAGDWYQPLEGSFETADQIAAAYLDRVAGRLRAQRVQVSTAIQRGAVADAIVNFAEVNHIDLVAICTHGRREAGRWALGSVADRVLRARCTPVLLVRAQRTRPEVNKADERDAVHTYLADAASANAYARHWFEPKR